MVMEEKYPLVSPMVMAITKYIQSLLITTGIVLS